MLAPYCYREDTLYHQRLGMVIVADTTGRCWIYPNPELLRRLWTRWSVAP